MPRVHQNTIFHSFSPENAFIWIKIRFLALSAASSSFIKLFRPKPAWKLSVFLFFLLHIYFHSTRVHHIERQSESGTSNNHISVFAHFFLCAGLISYTKNPAILISFIWAGQLYHGSAHLVEWYYFVPIITICKLMF